MLQSPSQSPRPLLVLRPPKLRSETVAALAGVVGGGLSTLMLHPFDVLKTRQAVFGGSIWHHTPMRHSLLQGLYRGVGANILVAASSWGVYFTTFDALKKAIGSKNGINGTVLAAFGAGSICTLLTNPLSVVRSRILLSEKNHGKGNYSTIGRTIVHIAKTEGIAGFYKSPLESLACCIVSKLIATLITYPCQNLRARKQAGDLAIAANSPTTLTNILQKEGFCGLYRGLVPTLIHVTPNVCIVFLAYEFLVGGKML